jgi:glycosyltransferase involved in cell wall biosynthesis
MGVDLRSRFVLGETEVDAPTLVFAGRLAEVKGVDDLLNAMPSILGRVPNTKLLIAGDGPLASELHNQCEQMGLQDAVKFLGSVANERLPELFRKAQLVTLPFKIGKAGDQEGLGLVTIEAMGCGVPVLAGDVPALSDVVTHDRNGWLVSSGDPQALAEGVVTLLQDPQLRKRLATQARADVLAVFDWSVAAQRYRRILRLED